MNDIRQVTNFSSVVTSASQRTIAVYVDDREYVNVDYYILPVSLLTGSLNTPINKLGYVCEPKGFNYPIIITTANVKRTIYLGKTGMFETMPETFLDINDEHAEELECVPQITEIEVPKGIPGEEPIKFKLDYAFTIN